MNSARGDCLEVACGLIFRDNSLLVAQRADNRLWELPGGKLEPGEDPGTCLEREIAEELATRVEDLRPFSMVEQELTQGVRLRLHAWFCRLAGPEPRPLEHLRLCWLEPARTLGLALAPADRVLLARYLAMPPAGG
jgi:8-oxo-dGTP pyrophosphatase MutT (NUDIX family)